MNSEQFKSQMASALSDVPEHFHNRVEMTLETIVDQEEAMKESTKKAIKTAGRFSFRTAVIAFALILALGAAAVAAVRWRLFDQLSFMTGPGTPKNADSLMQGNLYQETVNDVEITVREAGYDGRTLFLQYSYRMLDVDTPFGVTAREAYGDRLLQGMDPDSIVTEGLREDALDLLDAHHVGWWIDSLWINGKAMDMSENSGGMESGSAVPGEIIVTEYWRLDNAGFTMNGPTQISLPIGETQPLSDYGRKNHPEKYDENGLLKLPEKGVVTFTYDAKDILSQVKTLRPNVETKLREGTVRVSEAAFTPLMTYITLDMQVSPEALEAYIQENGEGHQDEAGNLLFPYSGMDVFAEWIMTAELVDGSGNLVFPGHFGQNGYGSEWAEFLYPYLETLPAEMYLAPIVNGQADMTRAVAVKPVNR